MCITLQMAAPEKTVEVAGQVTPTSVSVVAKEDGQDIMTATGTINKAKGTVSCEAKYSEGKQLYDD